MSWFCFLSVCPKTTPIFSLDVAYFPSCPTDVLKVSSGFTASIQQYEFPPWWKWYSDTELHFLRMKLHQWSSKSETLNVKAALDGVKSTNHSCLPNITENNNNLSQDTPLRECLAESINSPAMFVLFSFQTARYSKLRHRATTLSSKQPLTKGEWTTQMLCCSCVNTDKYNLSSHCCCNILCTNVLSNSWWHMSK